MSERKDRYVLTNTFPDRAVVLTPAERDEEMLEQREERKAFEETIANLRQENATLQKQLYARCEFCTGLIRKNTAREILRDLQDMAIIPDFTLHLILNTLSQKYGVEVKL